MNSKYCKGGSMIGHTLSEYTNVGTSPCCGEYVSHVTNKKCNVIKSIEENFPKTCQCKTDRCPCGFMISHRIDEVCNADESLEISVEDFIGKNN